MLRIIKYFFGSHFQRDLTSLISHYILPPPDILFVAGSQVDLQWVIPIYESSMKKNLHCAFAGPDLTIPQGSTYYNTTMAAIRFYRTTILVTATSGLSPVQMPLYAVRRVAVLHSLVSLHMAYPAGTFEGYTDIFCCGKHHIDEVEAMNSYSNTNSRRPLLIGYGKFEQLAKTRPAALDLEKVGRHVLIGSSWGKSSILETMGHALISRLLTEGFFVTLRPHPSFFTFGNDIISQLMTNFIEHPAFCLENSIKESDALWTADFIISDYSGFAMEFAFIRNKPVLYIDLPPKVLNPDWKTIGLKPLEIEVREHIGLVVAPEVDAVISGLAFLKDNQDLWVASIAKIRESCWVNFGYFGDVCAKELTRMLGEIQK